MHIGCLAGPSTQHWDNYKCLQKLPGVPHEDDLPTLLWELGLVLLLRAASLYPVILDAVSFQPLFTPLFSVIFISHDTCFLSLDLAILWDVMRDSRLKVYCGHPDGWSYLFAPFTFPSPAVPGSFQWSTTFTCPCTPPHNPKSSLAFLPSFGWYQAWL